MRKSVSSTSQPEVDDHAEPPSKRVRVDPFADLRAGSSTATDRGITDVLSGCEELARYKALQVPAKHSIPQIFWRENAVEISRLPEVARFFVVRLSQNETFHLWAVP